MQYVWGTSEITHQGNVWKRARELKRRKSLPSWRKWFHYLTTDLQRAFWGRFLHIPGMIKHLIWKTEERMLATVLQVALVVRMHLHMQETQETQVRSLGWEDPPEKRMATHPSIHAWRIPLDRGPWWATVHGVAKSWTWPKRLRTRARLSSHD